MCGRFTMTYPDAHLLAQALDVADEHVEGAADYQPRYNLAPTDWHYILRIKGEERQLLRARWGLVNSWAKDNREAARQINARAETVASRPAFRDAFLHRRCIVPADGFYEWERVGKEKYPFWLHRQDGKPLLLAGVYESWQPQPGMWERTFAIVTRAASPPVERIHDRMPAVLDDEAAALWMFGTTPRAALDRVLAPGPADTLVATAVSPLVNSVRNDGPSVLLAPLSPRLF